jgi:antitoxin (DNA-binding transcriptional repressor) of toxin-antitoxin stability system
MQKPQTSAAALLNPRTLGSVPVALGRRAESFFDTAGRRSGTLGLASRVDEAPPVSDNQIMAEISATEASKRFADMLDAVEHHGEIFTVVRRGRAIATVSPARHTTLAGLRSFLRDHRPDDAWERDLADIRRLVGSAPTDDPWSD